MSVTYTGGRGLKQQTKSPSLGEGDLGGEADTIEVKLRIHSQLKYNPFIL